MTVVFEAFSKKLTECEGKLFSTAFFLKLCSFIVAISLAAFYVIRGLSP